ncbi:MAG: thermonuclease family protein [Myxococcota bacterium]
MRHFSFIAFFGLFGCTPLEERLELFGVEWCADPRNESSACVTDGDTFSLADCAGSDQSQGQVEVIRLLGIDTPEMARDGSPEECYGSEATEYLQHVLQGRSFRLEFDQECFGTYERTLAWVFISGEADDPLKEELDLLGGLGVQEDGSFEVLVNELMIRAGFAVVYEPEEDVRYFDRLMQAEQQAMAADLGLWSSCDG